MEISNKGTETKVNVYESQNSSYKKATESSRVQTHILNPHVRATIGDIKGKNVLDYGCGFGKFLKMFENSEANLLMGVDIDHNQIQKAKEYLNLQEENNAEQIKLLCADATDPDLKNKFDNEFDVIYSTFCLNFMPNESKVELYFENIFKLLKEGGKMYVLQGDEKVLAGNDKIIQIIDTAISSSSSNWEPGASIKLNIAGAIEIYAHYWNYEMVEPYLTKLGFKNIKKIPIYLKEVAMEKFSEEEWDLLSSNQCYYIISASK